MSVAASVAVEVGQDEPVLYVGEITGSKPSSKAMLSG